MIKYILMIVVVLVGVGIWTDVIKINVDDIQKKIGMDVKTEIEEVVETCTNGDICGDEEVVKNTIIFCDAEGNEYKTEEKAREAGLSDSEFGATYCEEYSKKNYSNPEKEENNVVSDEDLNNTEKTIFSAGSTKIPKFFKDLDVVNTKTLQIEVSRNLKDCIGVAPQKCMQVRIKGQTAWKLVFDPIYGFDYKVGDYYILNIKEDIYNYDGPSAGNGENDTKTWSLVKVIKHIKAKVNISSNETMTVNIPTWEYSDIQNTHIVTFKKYSVKKTSAVLDATYKKLFQVKAGSSDLTWNGLKFDSVKIVDGIAQIKLSGRWYPVGDMSGAAMKFEVEGAAYQFDSVKGYEVQFKGKTFDWCIDDPSDGESGCPSKKQLWKGKK